MNNEHDVQTISVDELKKIYDINNDINLIDVRELDEWQTIHIPRAIHIAKDDLSTKILQEIPKKNEPIYLHCRGGVRSLHAASALLDLGYTDVYSVDGGILAWEKAGFPTET